MGVSLERRKSPPGTTCNRLHGVWRTGRAEQHSLACRTRAEDLQLSVHSGSRITASSWARWPAAPQRMEEAPEDQRVVRAVERDGDALEELLREFGPPVEAAILIDRRWRSSLDSEDVMQVTYLEAYLRVATLRSRTAEGFRLWLARIAENNLRDALRALQRDKRPDGGGRRRATRGGGTSAQTLMGSLLDTDPTAGSVAAARDAESRLREAIERLPVSYRHVVEEVDLAERPVAEVAAEWEKSAGAIHMLRSRAHDRLREFLGGRTRFLGDSA